MENNFQASAISKNIIPVDLATRPLANFHSSVWKEFFLAYAYDTMESDVNMEEEVKKLKEIVRKRLQVASANESEPNWEKLKYIDAIQRLGVSYHFENEIEASLQNVHDNYHQYQSKNDNHLYFVALAFRLLRQQGYPVSCDVFQKFKDNQAKFKESLTTDVQGMLSLYEAAHMAVHGEDVLDEAMIFTITRLRAILPNLSSSNPDVAAEVSYSLDQTIRRGLTRLAARHYISFYEKKDSHIKHLLDFAKLDFNLLQKLHQRELHELTRWWIDLDFANKLPFARDRLVECFFWICGIYFEPKYSLGRRMEVRVIAMTTIVDDIYDAYGTLPELLLFTDAIDRWDISAIDQLPEYMRLPYKALLDIYVMMEEEMTKQGIGSYALHYAKETFKKLARAYLDEAKWRDEGYVPTMEEYMEVAQRTGAQTMLATNSFPGMGGDLLNKHVFEWMWNEPLIIRAVQVICRLVDDVVGHKFEQERAHVSSAVECYMKQHDATEEETVLILMKRVESAWKDINAECLQPTQVSMPFLTRVINLARVIDVIYGKGKDCYTNSEVRLKEFCKLRVKIVTQIQK